MHNRIWSVIFEKGVKLFAFQDIHLLERKTLITEALSEVPMLKLRVVGIVEAVYPNDR